MECFPSSIARAHDVSHGIFVAYLEHVVEDLLLAAASRNISRQLAIPVRKVSAKKMRNVRFVTEVCLANLLLNRYAVSASCAGTVQVSTNG